jgi:Phasin protein
MPRRQQRSSCSWNRCSRNKRLALCGDLWRKDQSCQAVPLLKYLAICALLQNTVLSRQKFAFDKFMDATQSTMSTFEAQSKISQAAAKDVTVKIINFAEQNVASAFDYAQKLVRAKDPQTLLALHGEFISSQTRVLCTQAWSFGEMTGKVAIE